MVLEMDYADHYFYSGIDIQKEKIVKKEIAFFDFDGTITKKDTLLEFIKFSKGSFHFYLGFILNLPYLIAYKLKIISNQKAKEKILTFFFEGTPVEVFKSYCSAFSKNVLPKLIRTKAMQEIKLLKEKGISIVIVSASPENWIEDWANSLQLEIITTTLEIKNNKITGKILGQNCHGNEKVNRINQRYNLNEYNIVAAYGDSSGDKPMLSLGQKAFYKPFR
jgi:HAD superfamily hydrolase (TIGR01490 family)